eukprot:gnl/TRDRNA2_/TRDRNA2_182787_c0_seq1.p1 gnl/TRDRNA2_/TRDRNA2_182787_c0~~gnl/TRDRNA2_/TRDRNA2_182787_c0_seq1.p1  ORF type:complete len:554 (-),score=123.79 gnl/TRDRNA2_/TRDRNA2_182787_c0_seq1:197-1858(-)
MPKHERARERSRHRRRRSSSSTSTRARRQRYRSSSGSEESDHRRKWTRKRSRSRSRSRERAARKRGKKRRSPSRSRSRSSSSSSKNSGIKIKAKKPGEKQEKAKKNNDKTEADAKEAKPSPNKVAGDATKPADSPTAAPAPPGAKGVLGLTAGLGDLAELQKQLEKDRNALQLFVIRAKQELEDKQESKDKHAKRMAEYYKASFGEPVGPGARYLLEDKLGTGAFSSVYKCRDTQMAGKEFAMKFIRQNPMLRKATEKEVKLMRRLRNKASEEDPEGASCFLGLAGPETFEHEGHLCVVVQLMKCDLRSGLERYGQGKGFPLANVRSFGKNIFLALRALRKVNVIHSDLKPENLLMSLDKASVKLSDFGSAMDYDERVRNTDELQPRYYRAPEVILGQSYGCAIDVWSAGLTLFELATARFLFEGRTNNGMLREMLRVLGAFPKKFAVSGEFASRHFNAEGDFICKEKDSKDAPEEVLPMTSFPKPAQPVLKQLEEATKDPQKGVDLALYRETVKQLGDLVARCLVPIPADRFTPEQVLGHRFFQKSGTAPTE